MKIVNINVPKELAHKVLDSSIPSFVLDVVRPLERELEHSMGASILRGEPFHDRLSPPPIRKFDSPGYENIANLLHTIPIYLRASRPDKCDESNIVDLLGAYITNRKDDNPYIELYLSEIDKASGGDDVHFKWLFTKVLIHELAHAALDIFNQEHCHQETEKVLYCTQFGKWREESMANAIALRIIKDFNDTDFYDFCRKFVLSQPAEYALGALMEDFRYWDFRSVFDGKENGVDENLQQEWLRVVQSNPAPDVLHQWNEYLSSNFVYIYHDKYYTEEEKLVFDIVNDFLKDFHASNGRKMSIGEFKSIFPYIITGAEKSYEPSAQVDKDSRFTPIELEDGNLSLYYFWDNETLHQFIKNTNTKLTEYKNY